MTVVTSLRPGVSTSPTLTELKAFAGLIFSNAGAKIGPNRINRLAVNFTRNFPNGNGWMFFLYLANDVLRIADDKRQRLLANPDIARCIAYPDPTGETAVNHLMRGQRVHS